MVMTPLTKTAFMAAFSIFKYVYISYFSADFLFFFTILLSLIDSLFVIFLIFDVRVPLIIPACCISI